MGEKGFEQSVDVVSLAKPSHELGHTFYTEFLYLLYNIATDNN